MRNTPSSRRLWTILRFCVVHAIHTIMTWHLLILPNETRSKSATDGTWTTMHHVTMSCRLTGEVPWRLTTPWKPLPLLVPMTSTHLAVTEEAGVDLGVSRRELVVSRRRGIP
jgi:hypothetical protein